MSGPLLVVRADAGPDLGTGHVMRCLAVAAAWREAAGAGARVRFVRREGARDAMDARIAAQGFEVERLGAGASLPEDAGGTRAAAEREAARAVVVDGYGFDGAYERALLGPGRVVLALDDFVHTRHEADVVVNPGLGARPEAYGALLPGQRLLAGARYALIRPEFWPFRGVGRDHGAAIRRVLVTLGGSDPERVAPRVVAGLRGSGLDVTVVVGGADPGAEETARLTAGAGFAVLRDVRDMSGPMRDADLAIAAAGVTSQELLFLGTPALLVVVAENQRSGAEAAAAQGLALLLGWHAEVSAERVRDAVAGVVAAPERARERAEAGRRVVDGFGAARVVEALLAGPPERDTLPA